MCLVLYPSGAVCKLEAGVRTQNVIIRLDLAAKSADRATRSLQSSALRVLNAEDIVRLVIVGV